MVDNNREFGMNDIFRVLRKNLKILIAIPVVVTIAAAIYAFTLKDVYEVEASMEVGRIVDVPLESPATVADRITSPSYLAYVGKKLGYAEKPSELAAMVQAEPLYTGGKDRVLTRVIKVRAKAYDPKKAVNIVQFIIADSCRDHDQIFNKAYAINEAEVKHYEKGIIDLEREIAEGKARIEALTAAGAVSQVEIAYLASYVEDKESYILHLREEAFAIRQKLYIETFSRPTRIVVEPVMPRYPSGPHRIRLVGISFIVSWILAIMAVFVVDRIRFAVREGDTNAKEGP